MKDEHVRDEHLKDAAQDVAEDVTQDVAVAFWAPRRADCHLSAAEGSSSHPWPTPNYLPPADT